MKGRNMKKLGLNVYLAGEIHTDWRDEIKQNSETAGLDITFTSPVTDHEASDMCGIKILGDEDKSFWRDRKGAGLNAIRRQKMIKDSDVVVVKFGDQYKQWNAAFDAGYASALNKAIIILHDEKHDHALKEVDAAANATARTPEQVVEILKYVVC